MPAALRRGLRWLPLVVFVAEVTLVLTGVLSAAVAAVVLVLLEGLLALTIGANVFSLGRTVRAQRAAGADGWRAFEAGLREALPPPLARAIGHELGILRALLLAMRSRSDVPPGSRAVRYGRDLRPLLAAIAGVSVLEIVVVTIIVRLLVHVAIVGWILIVLSVYALLWLLGFRAALRVLPHVVGPSTLRLRFATFCDIELPLELIDGVRAQRSKGYRHTAQVDDTALAVSVMGQANVKVALRRPFMIAEGKLDGEVTEVRFFADDPADAVKELLAARDRTHEG